MKTALAQANMGSNPIPSASGVMIVKLIKTLLCISRKPGGYVFHSISKLICPIMFARQTFTDTLA